MICYCALDTDSETANCWQQRAVSPTTNAQCSTTILLACQSSQGFVNQSRFGHLVCLNTPSIRWACVSERCSRGYFNLCIFNAQYSSQCVNQSAAGSTTPLRVNLGLYESKDSEQCVKQSVPSLGQLCCNTTGKTCWQSGQQLLELPVLCNTTCL